MNQTRSEPAASGLGVDHWFTQRRLGRCQSRRCGNQALGEGEAMAFPWDINLANVRFISSLLVSVKRGCAGHSQAGSPEVNLFIRGMVSISGGSVGEQNVTLVVPRA